MHLDLLPLLRLSFLQKRLSCNINHLRWFKLTIIITIGWDQLHSFWSVQIWLSKWRVIFPNYTILSPLVVYSILWAQIYQLEIKFLIQYRKKNIYISKTGEPEKQLNETINYNEHFSWEWRQGRPGFGPFGKFFKFPEGMSIRMLSFVTHCVYAKEFWSVVICWFFFFVQPVYCFKRHLTCPERCLELTDYECWCFNHIKNC